MDPFLGQMVCFGGNFAPRSWALCEGQLLAINSNQALFSILGTTYGGDGRTTFALPDLRGRVSTQQGTGPGLRRWNLGERGGSDNHTIVKNNLPPINVDIPVSNDAKAADDPSGKYLTAQDDDVYADAPTTGEKYGATIAVGGNSTAISNLQPTLAVNWLICTNGVFPSRN